MEKLKYRFRKWAVRMSYACGVLTIALPARAFAAVAGGNVLPWDQPLNTLQTDLQGPVAHAVTTAAIIGTGITWAVSEHGTGVPFHDGDPAESWQCWGYFYFSRLRWLSERILRSRPFGSRRSAGN
jgi:type IV secretory pathway VirB2 component (pilin)